MNVDDFFASVERRQLGQGAAVCVPPPSLRGNSNTPRMALGNVCPVCGDPIDSRAIACSEHRWAGATNDFRKHRCPDCDFRAATRHGLTTHRRMMHRGN